MRFLVILVQFLSTSDKKLRMESSSSVLEFILSGIDAEKSVLSVINTRKTKSDWSIKGEKLWLILFIDWFFLLEGASKYVWFYYQYSTSVIWTMYLHIKLGHLKAPDAQKSQKCVFLLYWHQRIIVQYLGISYIKLLSCYHDILGGT